MMIATKFVKCIGRLFFKSYSFLSPKAIRNHESKILRRDIKSEAYKLNIEKSCENLDLKNVFKVRNLPMCKSDVSCISKASRFNQPPTCHSEPCFHSKLWKIPVKTADSVTYDERSSLASCTSLNRSLKECKSEISIHNQWKYNSPKKPSTAPCNEVVRELCEKAMKTCSEARKIINFYKGRMPQCAKEGSIEVTELMTKPANEITSIQRKEKKDAELLAKNQDPCPYCTQSSSIPSTYSCPFCSKNIKNCTCIHCPHCKKSKINSTYKKPYQIKSKTTKFDKPQNYLLAKKPSSLNKSYSSIQEKLNAFSQRHHLSCDFKELGDITLPHCKIINGEIEGSPLHKIQTRKLHTKNVKNNCAMFGPQELRENISSRKPQSLKEDKYQNVPTVIKGEKSVRFQDPQMPLPWAPTMPSKNPNCSLNHVLKRLVSNDEINLGRSKTFNRENLTNPKFGDDNINDVKKRLLSYTKSLKLSNTEEGMKNERLEEGKGLQKSSVSGANRQLLAPRSKISNGSVRDYSKKDEPLKTSKCDSGDFLKKCPRALRKIGKCEKEEYDEYFTCYKNMEYFKYNKYAYYALQECMKTFRLSQPSSLKKDDVPTSPNKKKTKPDKSKKK